MIDISKALKVEGWMSESELLWLAQQAQTRNTIVEIGSYLGRSTRALSDNTLGRVFAFDDFRGPREVKIDHRNTILSRYIENTSDCKNLCTIIGDHRDIWVDVEPDMVFIDGSHTYEHVIADIIFWRGRLRRDGLICGHDYTDWPGVKQAVDEFFPNVTVVPCTSIWVGGNL